MTNKSKNQAKDFALNGVLIALVFIATYFIQIRLPISINGGLVHLGNVVLFTIAILFGRQKGAIAGAFGMGIFDVITRKVFDKLDLAQIYTNAIAVKCPEDAKIPIIADTEEEALRVAIQVARDIDRDKLKIVRIKNTLELETIEVSDALLDCVAANEKLKRI